MTATSGNPILEVRDLTVSVRLKDGSRAIVVDRVSFEVASAGTLGLVGESGSGKTMTSLAIMGLLPPNARIEAGHVLLDGEDLLQKSAREMQAIRGRRIGMVLQDPMTALDPSFTVRSQLAQPLQHHLSLRGAELEAALISSLERVHLSAAKERLSQYPHQLSGGMRQRVTSAIALAGKPSLLIADEPTSALDATTQARYLRMLQDLQATTGFALLLVAHDLMVIRHVCESVCVMYSSEIVERGTVGDVFGDPRHPYTRALLAAVPAVGSTKRLDVIEGQAPSIGETLAGCHFASRCRYARSECSDKPELVDRSPGHAARCWGTEPSDWIRS